MAKRAKRWQLHEPRNRDFAEGYLEALCDMEHRIDKACKVVAKSWRIGLCVASHIALVLEIDMQECLDTMTGESKNLPVNPLPLSEVDPEPEDD